MTENRDALLGITAVLTLWGLIVVVCATIADVLSSMIQAWSEI